MAALAAAEWGMGGGSFGDFSYGAKPAPAQWRNIGSFHRRFSGDGDVDEDGRDKDSKEVDEVDETGSPEGRARPVSAKPLLSTLHEDEADDDDQHASRGHAGPGHTSAQEEEEQYLEDDDQRDPNGEPRAHAHAHATASSPHPTSAPAEHAAETSEQQQLEQPPADDSLPPATFFTSGRTSEGGTATASPNGRRSMNGALSSAYGPPPAKAASRDGPSESPYSSPIFAPHVQQRRTSLPGNAYVSPGPLNGVRSAAVRVSGSDGSVHMLATPVLLPNGAVNQHVLRGSPYYNAQAYNGQLKSPYASSSAGGASGGGSRGGSPRVSSASPSRRVSRPGQAGGQQQQQQQQQQQGDGSSPGLRPTSTSGAAPSSSRSTPARASAQQQQQQGGRQGPVGAPEGGDRLPPLRTSTSGAQPAPVAGGASEQSAFKTLHGPSTRKRVPSRHG